MVLKNGWIFVIWINAIFFISLPIVSLTKFVLSEELVFFDYQRYLLDITDFMYVLVNIGLLTSCYILIKHKKITKDGCSSLLNAMGVTSSLIFCFYISQLLYLSIVMGVRHHQGQIDIVGIFFRGSQYHLADFMSVILIIGIAVIGKRMLKNNLFNVEKASEQTTGNFGTASWADEEHLLNHHIYKPSNGILSGYDAQKRPLYLPLLNKLIISPQGGGKSVSSSIPVLLSHNGPAFVMDVKGELWATTARFRSDILKRQVVVIDPFNLTKSKDFSKGKSKELLKKYTFNPFDWIPENHNERDRMINSFASSFIINEGGSSQHFDDSAKILIRGYIDYMMKSLPKESRNLEMLYQLLSEHQEQADITFDQMSLLSGRAAAAANQISRVGADERGSIISTSYRQIDWMSDSNVQNTLRTSNFDLRDFTKGNMDIFIVVPEDQVSEHSRLVRMVLSLIISIIIQTPPSELAPGKTLFLLEELAQLGYCPDVEKAIEILRARNIVVWTVFQTLKQIELYKKPDLFKTAQIKQIFTTDDIATLEWIQKLGGKKTIINKTLGKNSGDSKQMNQLIGGSYSKGDSESVQEMGVDLIQTNEIREMPNNKQLIFVHGLKAIYCFKSRYFESKSFIGMYDNNPLETKNI